jgi:hypothetical protein
MRVENQLLVTDLLPSILNCCQQGNSLTDRRIGRGED